jgi:putative YhdH/YhfP family quinone oxidoreductase
MTFRPHQQETPVQTFKAYRTFEQDKVVSSRFVDMSLEDLDPGDVVIRTKYSTINYKDALSYGGAGRIMRKFPTVAGIDMAGTVESSKDPRWKRGDKVIVTGYELGVSHDGGYSEYVRVPADWIVRRPESMTAFDAMTLGTAGFTAALAVHWMQHNGLVPDNGQIAVTGATGGVGSVAIEILAKQGYDVVAITGKAGAARRVQFPHGSRAFIPMPLISRGMTTSEPLKTQSRWAIPSAYRRGSISIPSMLPVCSSPGARAKIGHCPSVTTSTATCGRQSSTRTQTACGQRRMCLAMQL